ncbi:hypothetical protein RRG08_035305 [Elysia crispata]|uniref:Uncharacterized protein n=1 Tax=Elysia crispata TaxID=231223 RepID=A0AAE0YS24_9GAST|nr:hypothetical protein RRG08_035305 [Elysia crispata]
MRLSHIRPSAEHRRRSSGNITLDSNTLYVTQEGNVGHVADRRYSVAEPLLYHGKQAAYEITRRASAAAASGPPKLITNRLSLQTSASRKSSISSSREDNAHVENVLFFPQTKKMKESYDLNVFRIKVLCVAFVIALLVSLFILYRRAILPGGCSA